MNFYEFVPIEQKVIEYGWVNKEGNEKRFTSRHIQSLHYPIEFQMKNLSTVK